jgi:hypothetical protein
MASRESTLWEIDNALHAVALSLLVVADPSAWSRSSQIVFDLDGDDDLIFREYARRQGLNNQIESGEDPKGDPKQIRLPIAGLIREDAEVTQGRTEILQEWNTAADQSVRVQRVTLRYRLKLYYSRVDESESILNQLLLLTMREKLTFDFYSEILGTSNQVSISCKVPTYGRIPSLSDRFSGAGRLLCIELPLEVTSLLGSREDSSRIEEIFLSLYPTPIELSEESEKELIVISGEDDED